MYSSTIHIKFAKNVFFFNACNFFSIWSIAQVVLLMDRTTTTKLCEHLQYYIAFTKREHVLILFTFFIIWLCDHWRDKMLKFFFIILFDVCILHSYIILYKIHNLRVWSFNSFAIIRINIHTHSFIELNFMFVQINYHT